MKKLIDFMGNAVGLIVMALVVLSSLLLFGVANRASMEFARPTPRVPTPTPLPGTPRAEPVKPLATQVLPTPGVWKGQETVTPQTYVPPSYPIHGPEDVISIVLNDSGMQTVLRDSSFRPYWEGATPGEPIFVKSISARETDWDYYVVPFYKEGRVSGLATVGVKDGMGTMGSWSIWDADRYPPVSAAEAKEIVAQTGHQVVDEPRLVYRWLREARGTPFWEVYTASGETFYVIFNKVRVDVYKATEVHVIH